MAGHDAVVDAVRETLPEDEGWRIAKARLTQDFERGEENLALTLVRGSGVQQTLPLDGEGPDE